MVVLFAALFDIPPDLVPYQWPAPVDVRTQNSNLDIPPQLPLHAYTEVDEVGAVVGAFSQAQIEAAFTGASAAFPIGMGEHGMTLRAENSTPMVAGNYLFAWQSTREDIPLNDPTNLLQFAYVADADSNPMNNYQASAQFRGDFFDNTDQWYAAEYDPMTKWALKVSDARNNTIMPLPSSARCILYGTTQLFVINVDEFSATTAIEGRYSVFAHTGGFGQNGDPWSADITPPVVEERLSVDLTVRF